MLKKKSLGQHFLRSKNIISDIVNAGKVKSGDVVLEIGPGEGTLTVALLQTGAHVIAVEKDDRLIPVLQEKFSKEIKSRSLTLIHDDVLKFNTSTHNLETRTYKIIANIPYYITGQIIRMFLESENQPESMTLLVQKEVAERIVAKPSFSNSVARSAKGGFRVKGGKESLLSLSVKAYGHPKYIRTVGRGAFSPQPNVDSAVLCIENISRSNFKKISEEKFFEILHAGFAHKRKQLLPNLSTSQVDKSLLVEAFRKCEIDLKARAEDVPLKTWLKLCSIMS